MVCSICTAFVFIKLEDVSHFSIIFNELEAAEEPFCEIQQVAGGLMP
jgi:hypothetical protein